MNWLQAFNKQNLSLAQHKKYEALNEDRTHFLIVIDIRNYLVKHYAITVCSWSSFHNKLVYLQYLQIRELTWVRWLYGANFLRSWLTPVLDQWPQVLIRNIHLPLPRNTSPFLTIVFCFKLMFFCCENAVTPTKKNKRSGHR